MEEFLASLPCLSKPNAETSLVMLALSKIAHEVTHAIFKDVEKNKRIPFIQIILKFLIASAEMKSSNIRVAACSSCGNFLIHIFPFFSSDFRKSFSEIAEIKHKKKESSIIVASIFVFLANHTKKTKIPEFIQQNQVLFQFSDINSSFFDSVPNLISSLGTFDKIWMKDLLNEFIQKVDKNSSNRSLMKSILSIALNYPEFLEPYIINPLLSKENASLSLISFLFSSKVDFSSIKDMTKISSLAFKKLNDSQSSLVDKDSALQMLSLIKEVKYEFDEKEKKINVRYKDLEANIEICNFKNVSSLYRLPIPALIAYDKDDGNLTATVKWETAGKLGLTENFEIYYPDERPGLLSPYLQGVSYLVKTSPKANDEKLRKILKKCIFCEQKTWFHSYDVLCILKNISRERSMELFGEFDTERIALLAYNFVLNENKKLSSEAILFLSKFLDTKMVEKIVGLIDYFDTNTIERVAELFYSVPRDIYTDTFCSCLADSIPFHASSIEAISQIFITLQKLEYTSKSDDIALLAYSMASVSLQAMFSLQSKQSMPETLEYIRRANYDVSTGSLSFKNTYKPLHAALLIYSTFDSPMFESINCANSSFMFLPKASSVLMRKFWSLIKEEYISWFADIIFSKIDDRWDLEYFADWCVIFDGWAKYRQQVLDECSSLMNFYKYISDEACAEYITFIAKHPSKREAAMGFINDERTKNILAIIKRKYPIIYTVITGEKVTKESTNEQRKLVLREATEEEKKRVDLHVKLQLSTEKFSDEELEEMLKIFIEAEDEKGLDLIFNYTIVRQRFLLFLDFNIPKRVLPKVFDYLIKIKSPESLFIANKYENEDIKGLEDKIILCKHEDFINSLFTGKIKKQTMIKFLRIATQLDDSPKLLAAVSLHLLDESKTMKRFYISLTIAYLLASVTPVLGKEYSLGVFSILNERADEVPLLQATRLYSALSEKGELPKIGNDFIKMISPLCGHNTDPAIIIKTTKLEKKTNPKCAEAMATIEFLLQTEEPSMLLKALRLFYTCVTLMDDVNAVSCIKQFLPSILQRTEQFLDVPCFVDKAGQVLTFLLSRPSFSQFYPSILAKISQILPEKTHPSFQAFTHLIPRAIAMGATNPHMNGLSEMPAPIDLFKIDMMCIRERVEKVSNNEDRTSIIYDSVTTWLESIRGMDCPAMSEIIYEWENLILQYLGADQVMTIVCFQFHKYIPRFFPLFAAIGKFLRKRKRQGEDIERMINLTMSIVSIKAHAKAIELLGRPEKMKEALRLAAFTCDCPESDAIIASL